MLLHDFSPDRRARGPETHAKPNPKFGPAYSDDGCRCKQRSSKPDPKNTCTQASMQAARQLVEA
jgi:hypothetical protein